MGTLTNHRIARRLPPTRVRLLGVDHDCLDVAQLLLRADFATPSRRPMHVVTSNMNFLTLARKDVTFARVLGKADIVTLDGRPLLWAARALGHANCQQITGHDLFVAGAKLAAENKWGVFLLGSGPGVAMQAAAQMEKDFPGLRAMGTDHGHFDQDGRTDNELQLIKQIRTFRPHFMFVALGAPKQEFWIARNLHQLGVPICVGIGCVLDVYTGNLSRAPRFMQRAGLESLFQLVVAPRRWGHRYLLDDPPTACRLAIHVASRYLNPDVPAPSPPTE